MKRFLLVFSLFCILTSGLVYIYTKSKPVCIAGRGCCSSHGGVCGCSNGRSRCCDGSLSPSCHCFKDDFYKIDI